MSLIPEFPNSKKLTIEDKVEIERFSTKFAPYSDFNFTSLYCYNVNDQIKLSRLNDNLVVLFQDYLSDELFYSFIGKNKVIETAIHILSHCQKNGLDTKLKLVPECVRSHLVGSDELTIIEDDSNHDYILSISELCTYKGEKFRHKRNGVSKFIRTHNNIVIKNLNPDSKETKQLLLDVFSQWCESKMVCIESANHEFRALYRLLDKVTHFQLIILGVFVNGQLTQFSISEIVTEDTAIVHFEKHDYKFEGASAFGFQELAKHLNRLNCKFLNVEQDLGIPGLQQMKRQFRPLKFLKKYIISFKNCKS